MQEQCLQSNAVADQDAQGLHQPLHGMLDGGKLTAVDTHLSQNGVLLELYIQVRMLELSCCMQHVSNF